MRQGTLWREQAAAKIKREFHPGRGKDDPGAIGPLALEILAQEDVEHLVSELERINGKPFDRFDTDEGNGIDLPEILSISVFWGKYALRPDSQRFYSYDIHQIEASYEATADPDILDRRFREMTTIAKLLAIPRSKGRQKNYFKVQLIRELYDYLRKRFGNRPSDEDLTGIIHIPLGLVRMGIEPESVRKVLERDAKRPADEIGTLERARRLYKAERRTGSPRGRRRSE